MTFRSFLILTSYSLLFLSFPLPAQAHSTGPPFFKIGGQLAPPYSVQVTSLTDFKLPQDISPVNYRVGETIEFEIDTLQLIFAPEVLAKTTFLWDFGDGQTATGIKNSHRYTQPGSKLLTIKADLPEAEPQLIESALINILPGPDWQLPEPVLQVNGQRSNNPDTEPIKVDFNQDVQFDATASQAPSSPIVSYFWDFGDGSSSTEARVNHHYQPYSAGTITAVLRITDNQGFYVDRHVWLKPLTEPEATPTRPLWPAVGIGLAVLGLIIGVGFSWRKGLQLKKS